MNGEHMEIDNELRDALNEVMSAHLAEKKRRAAVATFRRAMRRYEKRAQALPRHNARRDFLASCANARHPNTIAVGALSVNGMLGGASAARARGSRTIAFLFERAASAVARLQEALS